MHPKDAPLLAMHHLQAHTTERDDSSIWPLDLKQAHTKWLQDHLFLFLQLVSVSSSLCALDCLPCSDDSPRKYKKKNSKIKKENSIILCILLGGNLLKVQIFLEEIFDMFTL